MEGLGQFQSLPLSSPPLAMERDWTGQKVSFAAVTSEPLSNHRPRTQADLAVELEEEEEHQ